MSDKFQSGAELSVESCDDDSRFFFPHSLCRISIDCSLPEWDESTLEALRATMVIYREKIEEERGTFYPLSRARKSGDLTEKSLECVTQR